MVAGLLLKSSWRFHAKHPLQLVLSMLGIVLGVSIVTSVLITNHSAIRAFALSSEALYGKATHQIVAALGLEDRAAAQFIQQNSQYTITPVVESDVVLNGSLVTLIGIDPFRESAFGRLQFNPAGAGENADTISTEASEIGSSWFWLTNNQTPIWVSEATANRLNLTAGKSAVVTDKPVSVAGVFGTASRAASDGLVITDISYAQTLTNQLGKVSRLELVLEDDEVAVITAKLPPQWRLQETASRQSTMQAMTKGFQINLTAMSLLALLVGMFLIHNTMTFAVLQRREVFATKRLVGISANGLFKLIVCEAFLLSAIASAAGLFLGILIAHQLLQLTTQTINDLYFVLHVQQVHISPWVLLAGLILGIGSSVVAALLAATEAASGTIQAQRRSAIEEKTGRLLPKLLGFGCVLLIIGLTLASINSQSLLLGFAALMIVIVGYGFCIPWVSQLLLNTLQRLLNPFSMMFSFAISSLTNTMSRTGVAIAALAVAVSATLGVDIMIGSFRHSVDSWLQQTLQSDMYITLGDTDGTGRSAATNISDAWLTELTNLTGVDDISTGIVVDTVTNIDRFDMLVLSPSKLSEASYEWLNPKSDNTWNTFINERSVLISEPLANKHGLSEGSQITLFTEKQGDVTFSVAGVYRDYGSSHGRMVMHRNHYTNFWNNPRVGSIGITADASAEQADVLERVGEHTKKLPIAARVRDNVSIHEESLVIFDRTFAVTKVLRWLTMGVALIGIFSALLAMHLERSRDFAILRASGGSPSQIRQIIAVQSLSMGAVAGLLAIPLGWVMSEMLIHIINVRSFGWSMTSQLPPKVIPETLLLALGSAALAGAFPAFRLSKRTLVQELRSE